MDFSDIGSYSDDDVAIQLDKLRLNNEFHDFISSLIFPKTNKYFSKLQRIYVRREFSRIFSQCNSINQFQDSMAPLMKRMIEKTTDGFTYSGQENLTDQPTLFIGNHRDISLDPAFLNYLLHLKELNTVRIAIGDNLLDGGYAEIIMRLNKSFVVHREIKGIKETLRKLSKLSAYINQSLWLDKESIWIAQKQGRANDGNDFSDEGVLKMLFLNEKKSKSINEWRKAVNLTPIVISYEYDPLDSVKAKGWDHQEDWTLEQRNKNDIHELSTGIFGYKGRVHLHICKPICREIESTRDLSETIQKEILSNYHIWPTNEAALSLLPQLNPDNLINSHPSKYREALALLKARSEMLDEKEKKAFLMAYARPLINKKKAKLSSGL